MANNILLYCYYYYYCFFSFLLFLLLLLFLFPSISLYYYFFLLLLWPLLFTITILIHRILRVVVVGVERILLFSSFFIRFLLSPLHLATHSMCSIQAATGNCDRNHLELTVTSSISYSKDTLRATNRRERRYEFTRIPK